MGQNHLIDFSIQRELPGNMILEIGYIGRLGRRLPGPYALNADPYMFTDPASGQSFAQANDCIAQTLRGLSTSMAKLGSFGLPGRFDRNPRPALVRTRTPFGVGSNTNDAREVAEWRGSAILNAS